MQIIHSQQHKHSVGASNLCFQTNVTYLDMQHKYCVSRCCNGCDVLSICKHRGFDCNVCMFV
jgi:hypothetical protein